MCPSRSSSPRRSARRDRGVGDRSRLGWRWCGHAPGRTGRAAAGRTAASSSTTTARCVVLVSRYLGEIVAVVVVVLVAVVLVVFVRAVT